MSKKCEDSCESYSVPWHDHMGISGTCAKLENARYALQIIRTWTPISKSANIELLDIQKLCDKTLESIK